MASYTLSSGDRGAYEKTLVASTADTVTFPQYVAEVEVLNESTTTGLYCTTDGSTPTVGGGSTFYVPPSSARTIKTARSSRSATVVKVISSGTPKYSVSEPI